MPDIQVTSDVTADSSQFLADLQRDQSALDAFASYANSLKIAPQIAIDSTTATNSFKQVLATMVADAQAQGSAISMALTSQLSSVAVTLNTTAAQAQLQTLVASFQNINLSFNAPTAMQIGTDIGNAAAAAMAAAMGGMTPGQPGVPGQPGQPSPNPQPSPAGRSLASYLPHGFGRLLMPLMALHQGMRYFSIQDQEQEHMDASGGDVAKMLEADIRRKHEEDQLLMGAGRVMRFARESTLGPLMGESSVEEQESDLRTLKNAAMREKFYQHDSDIEQKHDFEYRRAMAPSSQMEKQEELREKQANRISADRKSNEERGKEIEQLDYARRVALQHAVKEEGVWSGYGQYSSKQLRDQAATARQQGLGSDADIFDRLAAVRDDDRTATERKMAADASGIRTKQVSEIKAKEDRELKENQELDNRQAGERADVAAMKAAGGDDAEIQRAELKIKLEKERQELAHTGTIEQKAAFEREAAAETQSNENKIQQREVAQSYKLEDIQYKADNASRALTIGKSAAGNEAYLHGLDEEIGKLEKIKVLTKDQRDELEKLKSVKAERIATHTEEYGRQREFEGDQSQAKVRNIQAEAAEALQQASGDTRGASRTRLERKIEDRADDLWQAAKKAGLDSPEGRRLLNERSAELGTMSDRMGAMDLTNQRADNQRIRSAEEQTQQIDLHSQHRGYEAGQMTIYDKYEEEMRRAVESHAPQQVQDSIRRQETSALEAHERTQEEKRQDIMESAAETRLRNHGQNEAARATHQEYENMKELREASGDPETQRAILARQREESLARDKGAVLHPANLRSAYDQLLGAASDPDAAKRRAHEAQLRLDLANKQDLLDKGIDPTTGKPLRPPAHHATDPAALNAKAAVAMEKAAADISAAALSIVNAPPVFLIGWT